GGANACILHYTENNATLNNGDLLLIDAGAEYNNYASDITRTFPVNGRFSEEQRALYDLVLESQLAAIKKVQPGISYNAYHDAAVRVLTKGLIKLGLLKGDYKQLIKDGAYKEFYMHRTGHWLGMDVHDVGPYKQNQQWLKLRPGMVLTVEPGLYISPDCKKVAKRWRGIGIRIEDDVVVTRTGNKVLSAAAPKHADNIEAIMQAA
ncbi:MAG: Xaa-Pro dipeptidase, partial [Gammaproteobacteria bacterium]|nr:Xaa-Pro dipeptidase [Gammaproteobacteria bacterium]